MLVACVDDSEPGSSAVEPEDPTHRRAKPVVTLVLALTASFLWALLINGVLDLLQSGGNWRRLVTYGMGEARFIFLISATVIWMMVLLVLAVTNRLFATLAITMGAALVLGYANYEKLRLRREPIYPSDLSFVGEAGFLEDMVGLGGVLTTAGLVLLITFILLLAGRILARTFPPIRRRDQPGRWARMLVVRSIVAAGAIASLTYTTDFNEPGHRVRDLYESAGAAWAFWFQEVNYARHGFVAGFLYNMGGPAMETPEDYSQATMTALSDKYAKLAEQRNQRRSSDALADVNIVAVLSEAFTDPTSVRGVSLAEDPIPFTRSLMKNTRSGEMLAQLFGGGTANMEFETLTGFSLSQFLPQMNTPYQMLVTETPTFPSVVGYLKSQGHDAVGIHPYMTTMYKRYEVYPTLGFSELINDQVMQHVSRIDDNQFISDSAAYDEVLHHLGTSERPLLVNLVTMQNHFPMADNYSDPIHADGVRGDVKQELEHYARGLKHSDEALEDFIASLKSSDERTAVILYGDHAPGFWTGPVYDSNGDDVFRRTPYLIWTNFRELARSESEITSPIYFMPTLFDDIEAPLPPYYALLLELQEEIPAMEQGEYFLPDGSKVTEEGLSPRARELLHDYRLVQYDLAVGERYSQAELFYPEAR